MAKKQITLDAVIYRLIAAKYPKFLPQLRAAADLINQLIDIKENGL